MINSDGPKVRDKIIWLLAALSFTLVLLGMQIAREAERWHLFDPPGRTSDPASWITFEDYPAAAIRAELQGTTAIAMTFAPDGRLTACAVITTSGHALLDRAACDAVRKRARLEYAKGIAEARTITRRVIWRLPDIR